MLAIVIKAIIRGKKLIGCVKTACKLRFTITFFTFYKGGSNFWTELKLSNVIMPFSKSNLKLQHMPEWGGSSQNGLYKPPLEVEQFTT